MKRLFEKSVKARPSPQPQRRHSLRGVLPTRITSYLEGLKQIRSGSVFSRIFRHMFEHKHAKRFLGSNLALLMVASSFVPTVSSFNPDLVELNVYEVNETQITTNITVRKPLKHLFINQGYHFFHLGVDFEGKTGERVYPIMAGTVERVERSNYAYGNSVVIDHNNGFKSRYAHLSKINVFINQEIDAFYALGEVGSTGQSSGDHLHLEIFENGRNVNPLNVIPRD